MHLSKLFLVSLYVYTNTANASVLGKRWPCITCKSADGKRIEPKCVFLFWNGCDICSCPSGSTEASAGS